MDGTRGRILLPGRLLEKRVQDEGEALFRRTSRRQPWLSFHRLSIAEEDDLCEREGVGMRDGQLRGVAADCLEPSRGAAMQLQLRWSAAPYHLDVAPQYALRVAGAERLHCCLFCCKASSEVNGRVAAAHAVGHLGLGKNSVGKTLAIPLDRGGNARDVRRVEPDSDDIHASQA